MNNRANRHTSFLTNYLADAVGEKLFLDGMLTFVTVQGHLCDFMIVSSENQYINCHVGIISCLSTFLTQLLKSNESDCLVLPDCTTKELGSLMNVLYTGV